MNKLVLRGRLLTQDGLIQSGLLVIDQETGLIEDVGEKDALELPKDERVLDIGNGTILPGLMDAHMHFFGSASQSLTEWVTTPETLVALRSVTDMKKLLMAGFTTVRDLGSNAGVHIARAEREGAIEGPSVIAASKSLSQTGGNDDPLMLPLRIAQELSYSYYCDGPWECRRAVRMCVRDGAEVIKVYASGTFAQGAKGRVQLTTEEISAITDEAHRAGLKVTAHAYGEDALENVIEAGVDSIEHGIALTDEIAARIKKKGIYYIPTLSAFFAARPSSSSERDMMIKRHLGADMELAKKYDLKIACGSDFTGSHSEPHGQNYLEISQLSKHLGELRAISAATSVAAECMGLADRGLLRKGCRADVVVARGNPDANIEALNPKNILYVIKSGRLYDASS